MQHINSNENSLLYFHINTRYYFIQFEPQRLKLFLSQIYFLHMRNIT